MSAFNGDEAKKQFPRQPDPAREGETVVRPFPLGAGQHDPNIDPEALANDDWWRPMTDDEVEAFLDGRYRAVYLRIGGVSYCATMCHNAFGRPLWHELQSTSL